MKIYSLFSLATLLGLLPIESAIKWTAPITISISETPAGDNFFPKVGVDASGNALAVWDSDQPLSIYDIFSRIYKRNINRWVSPVVLAADGPIKPFSELGMGVNSGGDGAMIWVEDNAAAVNGAIFNFSSNTWTNVLTIALDGSAVFSNAQAGFDNNGDAITIFQQLISGNYNILSSFYDHNLGTFSSPVTISNSSNFDQKARLSTLPSGPGLSIWKESSGIDFLIASKYLGAGAWDAPQLLTIGSVIDTPDVAVNSAGQGLGVWQNQNTIESSFFDGTNWGLSVVIATTGSGFLLNPRVAFNSSGQGMAVWDSGDSFGNFETQASFYQSGSWSTPVTISSVSDTGNPQSPQVAIDSSGNAVAIWTFVGGSNQIIKSAYYAQTAGTWSSQVNLSVADNNAASRPSLSMNQQGQAAVVWEKAGSSFIQAVIGSTFSNCFVP